MAVLHMARYISLYGVNGIRLGVYGKDREFDPDGKCKTDTDRGHPKHHPGITGEHKHDWDWSTDPRRVDPHM